jgi:hypothetical protein
MLENRVRRPFMAASLLKNDERRPYGRSLAFQWESRTWSLREPQWARLPCEFLMQILRCRPPFRGDLGRRRPQGANAGVVAHRVTCPHYPKSRGSALLPAPSAIVNRDRSGRTVSMIRVCCQQSTISRCSARPNDLIVTANVSGKKNVATLCAPGS